MNVFVNAYVLSFYQTEYQIVVSIGVLEVKALWIKSHHRVHWSSMHLSLHVHCLPIGNNIFQMVPPNFKTEISLVVEKVPCSHVVLRDGQAIDVPIPPHVGFVVSLGIINPKVIALGGVCVMLINVNVAFGIPITIVPPLEIE